MSSSPSPPSPLFTPLSIGPHTLPHRLILAPLTRLRASPHTRIPSSFAPTYYAQRASTPGTLLITEGTFISPRGAGLPLVPGLWTPAQLAAWKEVTTAVHANHGIIFAQLAACGRAADPTVLRDEFGEVEAIAPSPLSIDPENPVKPREMSEEEIRAMIADFATAAKNAVEVAGFDGVEIHAGSGYLVDQFTQSCSNERTDGWGGSVRKRARFAVEVARAVTAAVGVERTGMKLSPWSEGLGMRMSDAETEEGFGHLIRELGGVGLAYLHLVEARVQVNFDDPAQSATLDFAVEAWAWTAPVLLAGGYTAERAREMVERYRGRDVGIVFGRYFISNPDLVWRVREGVAFEGYDRKTFYRKGKTKEEGYTDYPFSREWVEKEEEKKGGAS
ncbi:FMN-linked oxidoreductase [Aulographum hederae CBS 113979]|uniref:FMN-linked oxidoreductase n=1 Tax=Aulographum hederae CBS 113979 TaxID=1176131 RepID=A0A6G1HEC0_9PEZI|nr:FMN-linked oxidoreductase [Aulographum hederae CBS 113979]